MGRGEVAVSALLRGKEWRVWHVERMLEYVHWSFGVAFRG